MRNTNSVHTAIMFELLAAASCTAFHDNEPLTAWQSCPYSITWTCPTGSEPHIVSGFCPTLPHERGRLSLVKALALPPSRGQRVHQFKHADSASVSEQRQPSLKERQTARVCESCLSSIAVCLSELSSAGTSTTIAGGFVNPKYPFCKSLSG